MDHIPQLMTIAVVVLLGAMSPGPDFVAVTSHALTSRRAGFQVTLGITAAVIIWASLALFGLGVLLVEIGWLTIAVRLAGAFYLIYLGARILLSIRDKPASITIDVVKTGAPAWRTGFLVGITNPKTAAFFGSLFITVLPLDAPLAVRAATLIVIGLVALGWFGFVALIFSTAQVRAVYGRIRRPIDALLGVILVTLGLKLALDQPIPSFLASSSSQ
jgi:threonine/homoserine/homoserine lactone efflux protein